MGDKSPKEKRKSIKQEAAKAKKKAGSSTQDAVETTEQVKKR